MRSIESEGDTIDEAIEKALKALQVDRDRVGIEILADATRGLFGFGGKKARVRATVRPPLSAHLEDDAQESETKDVPRETRREPDRRPQQPEERREAAARLSRSANAPAEVPLTAGSLPAEVEVRCRTLSEELFGLIGVSSEVRVRAGLEAGEIVLEVTGDSGGLLIGRRGQTLDAIEYVLNRMIGRGDDAAAFRIVVDIEGYRERRREYLEALARRLADKAKETGRVVTLNPMSPRDRRIVHLTLQGNEHVATRSQGDGYFRRMLILPAERAEGGAPASGVRR